jgi:GNAT superfamily N-acetyltransferase
MLEPNSPPPGKIQTTVTYLEMLAPPASLAAAQQAPAHVMIMRAMRPAVSFYRYLYNSVGAPWNWSARCRFSDEALAAIIHHPQVEIYVLYVAGVPAGYAELDFRRWPEVELVYFGLMPEFIGQGLGFYLIGEMIKLVWQRGPQRFWLHTCTLDHPKALAFYRKAGFVPYKEETELIDPRLF